MVIADEIFPGWPNTYEWVAKSGDGLTRWYQYRHAGGGYYYVDREQIVDPSADLTTIEDLFG